MKKTFVLIAFVYYSFGFSQNNTTIQISEQKITVASISKNTEDVTDKVEILKRMNWIKEEWDDKILTGQISLVEKIKIKNIVDSLRIVRKNKGL